MLIARTNNANGIDLLRLFRELSELDFEVKVKGPNWKPLKVPQVKITGLVQSFAQTHTGALGDRTLYFHAQAVYMDDLSTGLDIRGMSADTLLAIITEIHQKRLEIGR